MSNPVLQALMLARADDRLQQLKAPRSWDPEAKLAFLHLPPDLQVYYVAREKDRDRVVRRCQNDVAASREQLVAAEARIAELEAKLEVARKQLEAIQKPAEATNGTNDENCTAAAQH